MLLTITTTAKPATDLGFVLHKNPANVRSVNLAFGTAHVFYPEASGERCTAALLLRIDPVGLVRRRRRGTFALADHVNDRPYTASSFMTVAVAKVFGTALSGRVDGDRRRRVRRSRPPASRSTGSAPNRPARRPGTSPRPAGRAPREPSTRSPSSARCRPCRRTCDRRR